MSPSDKNMNNLCAIAEKVGEAWSSKHDPRTVAAEPGGNRTGTEAEASCTRRNLSAPHHRWLEGSRSRQPCRPPQRYRAREERLDGPGDRPSAVPSAGCRER